MNWSCLFRRRSEAKNVQLRRPNGPQAPENTCFNEHRMRIIVSKTRSAKPLCPGSNPGGTSKTKLCKHCVYRALFVLGGSALWGVAGDSCCQCGVQLFKAIAAQIHIDVHGDTDVGVAEQAGHPRSGLSGSRAWPQPVGAAP